MLKFHKSRAANFMIIAFVLLILVGKLFQIRFVFYLALASAFAGMTLGDDNYRVGFCLMLVPNVRIFDGALSQTYFVNILMAYPVFVKIIEERRINVTAAIHTLLLMAWEMGHILTFNYMEYAVANMACIILLYYVECILTEKDTHIDFANAARKLAFGSLMSSFMFFVSYSKTLNIFDYLKTARLSGYAGDPNYYSLYICLAVAMLLIIEGKHKTRDYVYVFTLIFLVLYTTSKMAVLTLILILMYFFGRLLFNMLSRRSRFIRRIAVISVGVGMFFSSTLVELIDKIVARFNENGLETSDVNSITSNRNLIQSYYLEELVTNPAVTAFGYGLQYNETEEYIGFKLIAHNTYMDLIMSWGIVGVVIMLVIFWQMIRQINHIRTERLTFNHFVPMIITAFTFLALSCLSASMFWWVVFASLLPLKGLQPNENAAYLDNSSGLLRRKIFVKLRGVAH